MSTKEFNLSISEVLERVATMSNVKTDTDIAKQLGVSRQAITNVRKRGTIPYEKLCIFSIQREVSMDYLLFGIRGMSKLDGNVDSYLFRDIAAHFFTLNQSQKLFNEVGEISYYIATLYNRIISQLNPGEDWMPRIRNEVSYFFDIKTEKNYDDDKIEHLLITKIFDEDWEDEKKSLGVTTQKIHGDNNQVAGGDISNNDK